MPGNIPGTRPLRRLIGRLLLLSGLAAAAWAFFSGDRLPTGPDETAVLARLAPGVRFGPEKSGDPPRYEADNGWIAWDTAEVTPRVRGFGGPIHALVVMDTEGRIRGVEILRHHETRNFVRYVFSRAYLDRFAGRSVFDPLRPDVDIDAVSRATVTVNALAESVRRSSALPSPTAPKRRTESRSCRSGRSATEVVCRQANSIAHNAKSIAGTFPQKALGP